jgi:hypothetical protein
MNHQGIKKIKVIRFLMYLNFLMVNVQKNKNHFNNLLVKAWWFL